MGAGTLKKDDVKKAQQALKQKGHNPGPVDGIIGPKTQAALRDFQQTQGLSATGTLDTATKQALGIENSAAQSKAQQ
ncbi:MAG: peptidoglycan-binding protein [Deltaproteobacteria bacterium]|nr:peptidoglycan-binding protein [Deltaproteobacteria bacterium]